MLLLQALLFAAVRGSLGLIESGFDADSPRWVDTGGSRIEAHSAGLLFDDVLTQQWYWYGESAKTSNQSDHGVNAYRSASLVGPWEHVGQVLTQQDVSAVEGDGPWIIERPKVLYNADTALFVMWFHLDDTGYDPSF